MNPQDFCDWPLSQRETVEKLRQLNSRLNRLKKQEVIRKSLYELYIRF